MKKIILTILLIVSPLTYSQQKITAKFKLNSADSIAKEYSSDAQLLLVKSSEVDSNGLSGKWDYVYASQKDDKEYHFSVYSNSIKYEGSNQLSIGIGVIKINWVDSDSALSVIKKNGGRDFFSMHPNSTIEASLINYLSPPFDTYWRVVLKAIGNTETFHQNAESGEFYTSIEKDDAIIDNNFVLFQNYPNPFNPITKLKFFIPKADNIMLKVYDILGNEIAQLLNEYKNPGLYEVIFDGSKLASGVYFFSLITEKKTITKKLALTK